jgi:penicillin-binding protein 1A
VRKLLILLATIVVTGAVLAGTVVAVAPQMARVVDAVSGDPEDIDLAALDAFAVRSQVFARDGSLLATLHGPENRQPVPLGRVPQPVIDAVLAVEDAEFYQHGGVNFRAMTRALFENVSAGGVEQGGSTITQQLVKNALLTSARDLERKKKEIPLAIRLEDQLTKDEILEKYLNTVYFGSGAYGVQAAAETYWGVDVDQLGHAEGAMLAALIANPVEYDPTSNPEGAYEQRRQALERMVAEEMITREEASELGSAPLPVGRCGTADAPVGACGEAELPPPDDYFVEEVKQQLLDDPRLGATRDERVKAVFGGGLRIYTTLDPAMQFAADLTHASGVPRNTKGVTAAMVTIENGTGAVRALVGGPGYENYKYNVVTQGNRQTGSAFKTLVVLTALEQGNLPFDTIGGGGTFPNPGGEEKTYTVSGSGGTLTSVTSRSSNGAFVRLGFVVGTDNVVATARRLGVEAPIEAVPSLPLGVSGPSPLEMTAAYATIPNEGIYQEPYFIDRVQDRSGEVIIEHRPRGRQAISEETACYATEILEANVRGGTGTRARLPDQQAAGKTGTTDENLDAWFIGFTPYFTTAVWMGNPSPDPDNPLASSMENLNGVANFGGTYPAMIWQRFNEVVHAELPSVDFPECPRLERSARPVVGQGNPFFNGIRFTRDGKIISGGSSSRTPSRSPSRSTSTTSPPSATTENTTDPPPTTSPSPPTTVGPPEGNDAQGE